MDNYRENALPEQRKPEKVWYLIGSPRPHVSDSIGNRPVWTFLLMVSFGVLAACYIGLGAIPYVKRGAIVFACEAFLWLLAFLRYNDTVPECATRLTDSD